MSRAGARDETRDGDGNVVRYKQWPATRNGDIDDNGTSRPMNDDELAAWDQDEQADADRTSRQELRDNILSIRDEIGTPADTPNPGDPATGLREIVDNWNTRIDAATVEVDAAPNGPLKQAARDKRQQYRDHKATVTAQIRVARATIDLIRTLIQDG